MFCSNCGTQIVDGARFCGVCGTQILQANPQVEVQQNVQQPIMGQVVYQAEPEVDPVRKELAEQAAGSALTWGILSLVFAYITGFLGIIFGCVGISKAKKFKELNNGVLEGKAKVGRGLSIGGLWFGVGMMIFWALYIGIIVLAAIFSEPVVEYDWNDEYYHMAMSAIKMLF